MIFYSPTLKLNIPLGFKGGGSGGYHGVYKGIVASRGYQIDLNEWYFLTIALEADTQSGLYKLRQYVNGIEVSFKQGALENKQGALENNTYLYGNGHDVLIGAAYYYNGEVSPYSLFHGVIDDIRIYSRTLTETEIKELFTISSIPSTCDLNNLELLNQYYIKFDEWCEECSEQWK
mmetsp:Transcript_11360/g.5715  ORF Transcript_11360/g.5715 Transcript_11360/m.5715 type:complete len:176 (+) Transcript_11360:31-558(+)